MSLHISRRALAAGGLLMAFASQAGAQAQARLQPGDQMSIGSPDAPLQLIEFASMTCPHCAHFHQSNWETLQRDYIDRGRMRVTLHEMLTEPAQAAFALFQLARAGTADAPEYFHRVGVLFARQRAIFSTVSTVGDLVNTLADVGADGA